MNDIFYFRKALFFSFSFHVVLILLAFLLPFIPFFKGKKDSSTYSSAVRVDLVELPDKLLHDINREIISTQDAIRNLKKEIGYDKDALQFKTKEHLKEKEVRAAIDRIKELQTKEHKKEEEKKESLRKGNVVSAGVLAPLDEPGAKQLDVYRGMLIERIKLRWALPSYLRKQTTLLGEVIVFLNEEGFVVRREIVSSGNHEFDEYMNRALEEAQPFPPVPREAQKDLRYDGLSITFLAGELK